MEKGKLVEKEQQTFQGRCGTALVCDGITFSLLQPRC